MFPKSMNKFLLSCLACSLVAGAARAVTPATPAPAAAKPTVPGAVNRTKMPENQILEYGSFELPRVKERLPKLKGGNFLLLTSDEWMDFRGDPDSDRGTLVIGLTNEVARTGRQSMYVEFSKLKKPRAAATMSSQLIAVKPNQPYRVGIWGRMDKKQVLTLDQPLPLLRLQVDFFQGDGETQTGDQIFRVQPMPGSRDRPPFFITKDWREYYAEVQTPEDAGFIKITWSWTAPPDAGEINGVMYFDDATLIGEKVVVPEEPEPTEPSPDGTPAPAPVPAPNAELVPPVAPPAAAPPAAELKATPVPKAAPAATPASKPRTKPK